ncbi:nuclease domain-containing protein [Staphylococcus haemolyticus]|uniref:nuclease domain-containing protein n=1 Tax=Staphylococcus haemolyticus TaxID=1283 RepID=UPI0015D9288C|nr:nuclease domain-containing protein [Staphylococcus haemolyticus]
MALLTKISYSELPFQIEFLIDDNFNKSKIITTYSQSKEVTFIENLEINEYSHVKVNFKNKLGSKIEAKLYMDCFDYIDYDFKNKNEAIINGERAYIEIGESITIHYHQDNDVGKALIPGVYKLCVEYNDNYYYSQFLIRPKNINNFEHQLLIEDIEKNISGLAREWTHINKAINNLPKTLNINETNLDKCMKIANEKYRLIHSIKTIKSTPYLNIVKNYVEKKQHTNIKFDNRSLKLNQIKNKNIGMKNSGSENKIIALQMEDDWNNKVNGFLFQIINQLILVFNEGIENCETVINYWLDEIDIIKKYSKRFMNMGSKSKIQGYELNIRELKKLRQNFIQINLSLTEFKIFLIKKGVKTKKDYKLSKQIIKTKGYSNFYKYYLIINEFNDINLGSNKEYNWKPTELLYEYWTYLQIITYFEKLGFDIIKNPLKSQIGKKDNKFQVNISDGTMVEMHQDNYRIEIIFNEMIYKDRQLAIDNNQYYWIRDNRNKPDIRINIFKGESFDKLIVLDAKYTDVNKFWKRSNLYNNKNKIVEQLKTYANKITHVQNKRMSASEIVIALCPTYINNESLYDSKDEHLLGVATMKPGIFNQVLLNKLEELIYE